jgi:glucose/mannose transport system permease protein
MVPYIFSWIVFGLLLGSLGSYLLYRYFDREEEQQHAALIGGLVGAVGNLIALIPLWIYLYSHNTTAPSQLAAAGAMAEGGSGAIPATSDAVRWRPEAKRKRITSDRQVRAKRTARTGGRLLLYVLLIVLAMIYLMPMYTVITTSLKTPDEAGQLNSVWNLPTKINWNSYQQAWDLLGPKLRNSVILTITATILSAIMGSINGYVLAKWRFPGANIVFPLMLFGMFIPYQSVLIPVFQFMSDVNLGGTVAALIITHVVYGLPITTLIFRNYYVEVPTDMIEAGKIDGAGFFGVYRWIVFPLSLPGFVVVIIWQFTQIWNEFLFAVTLTSGTKAEPITVALAQLAGGEAVKWNLPMAGAVMAALPTLLVFIFLGRYFIRGLLAGSVKG